MPPTATTEAALLKAVYAAPDDDLPRLVYADWCDENGDGDRAEFIRTEIEMARLAPDRDTAPDERECPRFRPLEERAGELWNANSERWFPGLKRCAEEVNTDRGFPYHIATSAARFVKHAADLFAVAPTIHDVILQKLGRNAAALAGCKAFSQVQRLSFFETPFRRPEAEAFFTSVHLHALRGFDIGFTDTQMGPDGATALAACPSLVALEELNLHSHDIDDAGSRAILNEHKFGTLRHIDFGNNGLGAGFADDLADAEHMTRLRVLDLTSNWLTADAVEHLCGLRHLAGLERLTLSGNPLGPEATRGLSRATFAGNLTKLGLQICHLADEDVAVLLGGVFPRLTDLQLADNGFDGLAVRALAANTGLERLESLSLRDVTGVAEELAGVRTLPALRSVTLNHQPWSASGLSSLFGGPFLRPVEKLILGHTQITDAGVRALAAADLPHLKALYLDDNRITDAGARELVGSKTLTRLRDVWIQDNKLTAKGKAMVRERFGEANCWV